MAAPIAGFIQLPLDTSNTGKKRRTQTKVIGADTVHEDFVIPISKRNILGSYITSTGVIAIPIAAQNGTTTGAVWFYNPVGSTKKVAIEKIKIAVQFVALAEDLLAGNLSISSMTVTGTASGTQKVPGKLDSTMPVASADARTVVTGLTPVLVSVLGSFLLPVMGLATGGAGVFPAANLEWVADSEEEEIILNAGEGIVIWNASAVTTANRNMVINIQHSEYE